MSSQSVSDKPTVVGERPEWTSMVQRWVNSKAKKGGKFAHDKIVVTAGPWRMYDVSYESKTVTEGERTIKVLELDFYSVGAPQEDDTDEIVEML